MTERDWPLYASQREWREEAWRKARTAEDRVEKAYRSLQQAEHELQQARIDLQREHAELAQSERFWAETMRELTAGSGGGE